MNIARNTERNKKNGGQAPVRNETNQQFEFEKPAMKRTSYVLVCSRLVSLRFIYMLAFAGIVLVGWPWAGKSGLAASPLGGGLRHLAFFDSPSKIQRTTLHLYEKLGLDCRTI